MKPPPQVVVVVVSYNTKDLLMDCLSSILNVEDDAGVEIVVVDNASRDGSLEAVRQTYPEVRTIGNQVNRGFGAACNQAISATASPFILLLNSDATITRGTINALVSVMNLNPRCGAAGCRIVNSAGVEAVSTRNFLTPFNQAIEQSGLIGRMRSKYLWRTYQTQLDRNQIDCQVDWVDGACLLLRRAALDDVGLFDEDFFIFSEDEDLCFRLRTHGWTICYTAAAVATHHGGASTAQNRLEMLCEFYSNQMLFLSKHRGESAARVYAVAIKAMLLLKSFFRSDEGRRSASREQLAALKNAKTRKTRATDPSAGNKPGSSVG